MHASEYRRRPLKSGSGAADAQRVSTRSFLKRRALRVLTVAALLAGITAAAPAGPAGAAAGFGDVAADTFYTEAVQWLVDNEITEGTSPGCFSPERELTRGELAVFLWRYAERPGGGGEPFTDVGDGDFFHEAVAWMVNDDITTGTTPTTFHPYRTVTRGELVTFLWRFADSPAGGSEPFTDVAPDRFYSSAVAWASSQGITNGTSATTFHPYRPVTRAEMATFLWRLAGSPATDVEAGGVCGDDGNGDGGDEGDGGGTETFADDFAGTGPLVDYVTNNADALPDVSRTDGRYRAVLTDNSDNRTLHFHNAQGRLDARLLEFPFDYVARNIGIGTLADSQSAPQPNGQSAYIFAGVLVHHADLDERISAHVVIGHRGGTSFTVEGKNTNSGSSSVNDDGFGVAPLGRVDLRIVGNADRTLTVYYQQPNPDPGNTADDWQLYRGDGDLPGNDPAFGSSVYVGLITYAFGQNMIPFVGTADSIEDYSAS